jgi:UDP-N-acetylglucosamine 2-epimerase (non-hydrolysing)
MKLLAVAGARPNFMKIAPLMWEIARHKDIDACLVQAGQHYDERMSRLFFEELKIPRPDIDLEVGSGNHVAQTAEVVKRFEPVVVEQKPEAVMDVRDVNSTIASALTTVELGIPGAHIEAGLSSFGRTLPAEVRHAVRR